MREKNKLVIVIDEAGFGGKFRHYGYARVGVEC